MDLSHFIGTIGFVAVSIEDMEEFRSLSHYQCKEDSSNILRQLK